MDNERFKEIIKKAKQASQDDFLRFVTGIYNVDEYVFEHIWEIPIIASWEGDTLITTPLSTKTEDELLDIVDEVIDRELGEQHGCFISLNKMESEFTDEEIEEWKNKLDSGETALDYNAIIVYNEKELKKFYIDIEKENSKRTKPKTQEELEQNFTAYVKEVMTHERCHLNANYLLMEVEKFIEEGKEKEALNSSEVNGASLTDIEQDDIISSDKDTSIISKYNEERNEVLIDTLSQMMSNYKDGDCIEDCLIRIIESRNGKIQYTDMDDVEVLTMYTLFPEKLTEWAIFGAYDFVRENKLRQMIIDVCGTDIPLKPNQFREKVEEYVTELEEGTFSDKQIKMLEMLGFSINRKISITQIGKMTKDVPISTKIEADRIKKMGMDKQQNTNDRKGEELENDN